MTLSLGWCAAGIIACLFALIALLPRFDSTQAGAWGDTPDDDDENKSS